MRTRTPDLGWLVFAIALALRAGWVIHRWLQNGATLDYPDESLHWELARILLQRGELVSDGGLRAARMPAYPLFLAMFAGYGQAGVLIARLAQAVVGAGTAFVAYRFARKIADPTAACAVGLLAAIDPFAVFCANLLLTETLFTLLAVALTYFGWRMIATPRARPEPLIGVAALGPLIVLTRPSAALWVPAFWLLLWALATRRRQVAAQLLACVAAMVVCMLPWGLRNRAVLGAPAWLSTNGGVTLYDAQGPQADGSSNQAFLQAMPELAGLGEVERDRRLRTLALQQMQRDPQRVLRLAGVKIARMWNPFPNVQEHRSGLPALAGAVFTAVVVLAAVGGLIRAWRQRARRHQLTFWRLTPSPRSFQAIVWLPVIYFTLLHAVYIGSVRYRVPLTPFLAMAAATAFTRPSASHAR